MADEPSWEDLFRPKADPVDPERQVPEEYPPTRAFPAEDLPAATRAFPVEDLPAATPASPADEVPAATPGFPAEELPAATRAFPAADAPQRPAASDDPFSALFGAPAPVAASFAGAQPTTETTTPPAATGMTRRELRQSESGSGGRGGDGRGSGQPRKRKLLWLKITLPLVLVLGGAGGVAAFAWFNYNEQVRELLRIPLPTDYEGEGNGEEVIVAIASGDIGADVATTLYDAGVTMTYDAVYDYLLENPDIGFTPGNWRLQKEMSAESAVAALQDPANKVTSELLIREGQQLPIVLELIASTTGIPLEEVQAAAADPSQYGVPAEATSLEGYLFPATYELDGTETAQGLIQKLVTTMFERLDAAGVPVEQRHQVLTMASIIQREAGWNEEDFYKVSRVFTNRLEQGINLESDATVAYGTGRHDTVWTEPEERADASNPYNTYANPGLPIGPIGAPGALAIDAALHPADGPWLFFVTVNLETGETVFSETAAEHEAAAERLYDWCRAAENASYCD